MEGEPEHLHSTQSKLVRLYSLHFANDGFQASFLLLAAISVGTSSLNPEYLGFLTSIHFFMGVVMASVTNRLSQSVNSMTILVVAMAVYGACFLAGFALHNGLVALAIFIVSGMAYGVFHPLAFAMIAEQADKEKVGRNMGLFTAVGDIGRAVISGLVVASVVHVKGDVVSTTVGLIILVAAGTLFFMPFSGVTARTNDPNWRDDLLKRASSRSAQWHLLKTRPAFRDICVLGIIDSFASSALFVFVPLLLVEKGVDEWLTSVCLTTMFFGSVAGKIVAGWVADKIGSVRCFVLFEIINASAIIGLVYSTHTSAIIVSSVFLGVATKGTLPVLLSLTTKHVDRHELYGAFGVNQSLLGFATALAPLWLGALSGAWGVDLAFGVAAGLFFFTASLALIRRTAPATN